jgi:hypothetical protein
MAYGTTRAEAVAVAQSLARKVIAERREAGETS